MQKNTIIHKLKKLKLEYEKEGIVIEGIFGSVARDESTENSDIDILMHARPSFAQKYGYRAIERLNTIKHELQQQLGAPVDLASSSGMGATAKKFIIDQAIYL